MRLLRPCLIAVTALVFVGQAAAAPDVHIVRMRALAPAHGPGAGRVVVLTTVRYRPTRGLLLAAPNPTRTVDIGRLDLMIDGALVRDADHLVRSSGRPLFYTHRAVLGRLVSTSALTRGRLVLGADAEQIIRSAKTRFPVTVQQPKRYDLPIEHVARLPAPARPVCERTPVSALFSRKTLISVV